MKVIQAFFAKRKALREQQDQQTAEEFTRHFPGRCMICSCHDFDRNHGYASGPVEPHDCIEGRSRPKPCATCDDTGEVACMHIREATKPCPDCAKEVL